MPELDDDKFNRPKKITHFDMIRRSVRFSRIKTYFWDAYGKKITHSFEKKRNDQIGLFYSNNC